MNSRYIAAGTSDGNTLCDHLARSASFVVFEVKDGQVASRTVRTRATDQCGNHKTFVELLDGCDAVLCGGVGQGAVTSLAAHGIQTVVADGHFTLAEALERYLAGTLPTTDARVCLCG